MPSVKWLDSIFRSKTSPLSPNNVYHLQALALSAVKQGFKELGASYAERDQGENDHRLAPAQHAKESIRSATAARTNWG